jgi:hypothetical protein
MSEEGWHGTPGGTTNHKCKCPACRAAWAEYCLARRAERAKSIAPDDPRHGTAAFYQNHGCRCAKCREASTDSKRALRTKAARDDRHDPL